MKASAFVRLRSLRLIGFAAMLSGCSYGVRGGPTTVLNTAGVASIGGGVTAGFGIADDKGELQGLHLTGSLYNLGYDLVGKGLAGLGGAGFEYFYQPLGSHPFGFRAGLEVGLGATPQFPFGLIGASAGARYAFVDGNSFPFIDLGGSIGPGVGMEGDAGNSSSWGLAGTINLSVGWLHVDHFGLK